MGGASAASKHSAGQITRAAVGSQPEEERVWETNNQIFGACYNEEGSRDGPRKGGSNHHLGGTKNVESSEGIFGPNGVLQKIR